MSTVLKAKGFGQEGGLIGWDSDLMTYVQFIQAIALGASEASPLIHMFKERAMTS